MARRNDALSEDTPALAEMTDQMGEQVVDPLVGPERLEPIVDPDPVPVSEAVRISDPLQPVVGKSPRAGVLGPLLGGALAALGGFGLSHFNMFRLAAPDASVSVLEERVAALEARPVTEAPMAELAALASRVDALESAPAPAAVDLSGLEERLAAIEAMPAGGDASTAALAAKLAELERRLAAAPAGADQAEVDAALARLEAAQAEATARAEEAATAAAAAEQAASVERLRDAVGSGGGFEAELAASGPDLQAALAPYVAGVATLEALQTDFPEAARLALRLDRAGSEDGWSTRLVDFLAAQTGARSLTPREGTDFDAVLSRAEFALSEGRLADTVAEVKALEPEVQAPFADWLARAEARLAALAVLEGN